MNLKNYYKCIFLILIYIIYNIIIMNLQENEKAKIIFGLNLLCGMDVNGYKLKSINIKDDNIIFTNGDKEEKISIKGLIGDKSKEVENSDVEITEVKKVQELGLTETSDIVRNVRNGKNLPDTENSDQVGGFGGYYLSETSDLPEVPKNKMMGSKMMGGSKNVFLGKSKFSDTSSIKMSEKSINSETSSAVFNARSDKYSDTSVIGQIGGKSNEMTDTLMDVSEIKQRKSSKQPNLDMGIFRKVQSGGSVDQNIKRKMMDVGINSNSSTSSICE